MGVAYISLGSNIDPELNLQRPAAGLRNLFPSVSFSSVYRTAPQEAEEQPDFLNAVARVETDMPPEELLGTLQTIERQLGKEPPYRYGPRTIDLDLLLYDDLTVPSREHWLEESRSFSCTSTQLHLPHVRMHMRRFVLEPLCELIDPEKEHPVSGKTWRELLEEAKNQRCDKMDFQL